MTKEGFRSRLLERAARAQIASTDATIDSLHAYFRLLARWNRTINLTAFPLDPLTDEAVDRLFIEPLAAARYIQRALHNAWRPVWFDLGSGGGSPAIPLKIVEPHQRLSMIESRSRKAAFLSEVVRGLELKDTDVVNSRFEELTVRDGTVDLVTVRAVRSDASLVATASRLLNDNGVLAIFGSALDSADEWESLDTVQLLSWLESSQLSIHRRVPRGTTVEQSG